jgi:hypothetical protein
MGCRCEIKNVIIAQLGYFLSLDIFAFCFFMQVYCSLLEGVSFLVFEY